MRLSVKTFCLLLTLAMVFFTGICAVAGDAGSVKKQKDSTMLTLRISDDGKTIVDQQGNEIARFSNSMRVVTPQKGMKKLPGCMRCWKECIVYEGTRCVQWVQTCEWDFDCKSKSSTKQ